MHPGNIILRKTFDHNLQYADTDVDMVIMDYGCHKDAFDEFIARIRGADCSLDCAIINQRSYLRHFGAVSTWSPEFLKDPHSVDIYHDIWALGVLLFRFLTNEYPVWVNSFSELYEKLITNFEIKWESLEKIHIHWAIERLIKKMLDPIPENRILHDALVKICIGLSSDIIYKRSDTSIRDFLARNGDCWICPICRSWVFPSGSICRGCGQMIPDSTEWINPFIEY